MLKWKCIYKKAAVPPIPTREPFEGERKFRLCNSRAAMLPVPTWLTFVEERTGASPVPTQCCFAGELKRLWLTDRRKAYPYTGALCRKITTHQKNYYFSLNSKKDYFSMRPLFYLPGLAPLSVVKDSPPVNPLPNR
jgi:hypothetical protein